MIIRALKLLAIGAGLVCMTATSGVAQPPGRKPVVHAAPQGPAPAVAAGEMFLSFNGQVLGSLKKVEQLSLTLGSNASSLGKPAKGQMTLGLGNPKLQFAPDQTALAGWLWNWFTQTAGGSDERRNLVIGIANAKGDLIPLYTLAGCLPTSWDALTSGPGGIADSVTLDCQNVDRFSK